MWFWLRLRGKRVKTLYAVISETKEKLKKKRVIHDCHFVTNKLNFPINIFYIHSVSSFFSSTPSLFLSFQLVLLHSLSSARTQLIIVMLNCLFSSFFAFFVFYQDCLYVIEKRHRDGLSRDDWAVIWKWFVLWMLLSQTFNSQTSYLSTRIDGNNCERSIKKNVVELKRRFEVATDFGCSMIEWNESFDVILKKKKIYYKWTTIYKFTEFFQFLNISRNTLFGSKNLHENVSFWLCTTFRCKIKINKGEKL